MPGVWRSRGCAKRGRAKRRLYAYDWEYSFPHTPTTLALRTEWYKCIPYHGIWDLDALYDLQTDPHEQHNLIFSQPHPEQTTRMRAELHQLLVAADANRVPFRHKRRMGANPRWKSGSAPPVFSPQLLRDKDAQNSTRVGVIIGGHALPRRPLPGQNGRVWEQPAGAGWGRVTETGAGPAARSPWHCVLAERIV